MAGIPAGVLAIQGAAWGFAAGALLLIIIYGKDMFNEEKTAQFVPSMKSTPNKSSAMLQKASPNSRNSMMAIRTNKKLTLSHPG
ncbi:hypothetical protein [Corynebacterium poyangense]|uniref:hypothetical protein n=1 Tax=Corynebacterium poyangense TaxID=2684405 RepID=UPI001CCBAB1C|nr:hypothetical protein [Corynebacterium poyangense]